MSSWVLFTIKQLYRITGSCLIWLYLEAFRAIRAAQCSVVLAFPGLWIDLNVGTPRLVIWRPLSPLRNGCQVLFMGDLDF